MWAELRAAVLRHTPPMAELVEAGKAALGPAAAVAAALFAVNVVCFGRRSALLAGGWAMLVGCAVANHLRAALPWLPEPWLLEARPGQRAVPWHWVPLLFLLAQHDGMFSREGRAAWWLGWLRCLAIGGLGAYLLVPPELRAAGWPFAAFTLAVALGWIGSAAAARQSPGGAVGLGLALALFGASYVMAHAHSARFADALGISAAALLGISVVAFVAKADVGGAIPGVALVLPAILLVGCYQTFSEVPWYAFLLAALPPVTTGLLALPPVSRLTGTRKWLAFGLLCLGPTVAAVVIAVRAETLLSEEW